MAIDFKSGFIAIIGCPNVGKSTLLNNIVGQKVAIVSPKPQTTRNNIRGIVGDEDYQMVFIDTPGLHQPRNRLGEYMVKMADQAMDRVDAIVLVLDGTRDLGQRDKKVLEQLKTHKTPVVIAVNKVDVSEPAVIAPLLESLKGYDFVDHILVISAKRGDNVNELTEILKGYLPQGPLFFPDDVYTDQPERVLVAEFIREKTLQLLDEEVPHGIGVEIEKFEERDDGLIEIYATIYCERQSHKGIIIGKQGRMLAKVGEQSRLDMEWLLGTRVYLQLWVKVRENWRDSRNFIRSLGYD